MGFLNYIFRNFYKEIDNLVAPFRFPDSSGFGDETYSTIDDLLRRKIIKLVWSNPNNPNKY